jgi:DNA-directed RNA polymerase alpha subunit
MTENEYLVMKEMVTKYENNKKRNQRTKFIKSTTDVKTLNIGTRLKTVLYNSNIKTIGDLLKSDYLTIRRMRGYGGKLHYEMLELFKENNWEFPKDPFWNH